MLSWICLASDARTCLELGISDSSLAVTAREERYMEERTLDTSGNVKQATISKDGNFLPVCISFEIPSRV